MDPLVAQQSEKRRSFELDNGNKIIASCENDPFGFWHLHYEKGQTPLELKGQYTSFNEAHKAVTAYCNETDRKIVIVNDNRKTKFEEGRKFEDVYNPPELKTKTKVKNVENTVTL